MERPGERTLHPDVCLRAGGDMIRPERFTRRAGVSPSPSTRYQIVHVDVNVRPVVVRRRRALKQRDDRGGEAHRESE